MKTPDSIGTMIGRLIAKLLEKKILTTDEMIEILGVEWVSEGDMLVITEKEKQE